MRIAITSDVHYHPPWSDRLEQLASLLTHQAPDLLVLAGDVGEPLELFTKGLLTFFPVCESLAVVAGNHDVWNRVGQNTSQELWETLLPGTAAQVGYHWLEGSNLILGSVGVCGTIAWYDYSGRHPNVDLDVDGYEQIKAAVSNDGRYVDWPWSDREFAGRVAANFEQRLAALQENDDITDIVVVTHVPLFRAALRSYADPNQAVANAYYANLPLGQVVMDYSKVKVVFSGHVHYDHRFNVERDNGAPLPVFNIPSDYGAPGAVVWDVSTQEATAIRVTPAATSSG